MDERIESILEGCRMARFVEANLHSMANQPELLIGSCDEIIRLFNRAKENILNAQLAVLPEPHHASRQLPIAAGVRDWRSNSQTQAMDLLRGEIGRGGLQEMVVGQTGGGGGAGQHAAESGREIEPHGVEAASSGGGRASSSSQRQRRSRGGGGDRRVVRVAAPQIGNTEIPPDDGTWRKYGQKEILHRRFPRSYFRCTHQKMYQCPAKKLVQRLDNDPNTFEVTYRGEHTCHLSSTAPSVPPVLPPPSSSVELTQQVPVTLLPLSMAPAAASSMSQWLSMDISMHAGGGVVAGWSTSSSINFASGAAGPSTSRYGRDAGVDYQQPVVDMADAMFNSGSSSNTSMDQIFPSMDDRWRDSGERRS